MASDIPPFMGCGSSGQGFAKRAQQLQSRPELQLAAVLTLADAATFLRIPEAELAEMAAGGSIPARKLGGEWRFLKRALEDWLCFPHCPPANGAAAQVAEEVLQLLEERLRQRLDEERRESETGSRQAALEHFGIWKDDPTAEAMLADIYKRRREPETGESLSSTPTRSPCTPLDIQKWGLKSRPPVALPGLRWRSSPAWRSSAAGSTAC